MQTLTCNRHWPETLTKTLPSLKGYKIPIPGRNTEYGDAYEREHSTDRESFESSFKTIGCTVLEFKP